MAKIRFDLTNYRERRGGRVEPGRYRLQLEDMEDADTSKGGKMINVWLRVVGGEDDGTTITDRLPYQDEHGKPSPALFRLVSLMQALGLPVKRQQMELDTRQMVGKYVDADVKDGQPYNGEVRSEIGAYLRPVGGEQSAATGGDDEDLPDSDEVQEPAPRAEEPDEKPAKAPAEEKAAESSAPAQVNLDDIDL